MKANAFAAAFLMPPEGIAEFFEEMGISRRSKIGVEEVMHVQKYFGVSYSAMLYRLQNLGWLDEKEREHLMDYKPTQVARRLGYDVEIREEIQLPFPLKFVHLAVEAHKKGKISLGKLAELLKFSRQDTVDLLRSLDIPLKLGVESQEELIEEAKNAQ
jgi:Zn-dependent peptidase ImmA (M78 family)